MVSSKDCSSSALCSSSSFGVSFFSVLIFLASFSLSILASFFSIFFFLVFSFSSFFSTFFSSFIVSTSSASSSLFFLTQPFSFAFSDPNIIFRRSLRLRRFWFGV